MGGNRAGDEPLATAGSTPTGDGNTLATRGSPAAGRGTDAGGGCRYDLELAPAVPGRSVERLSQPRHEQASSQGGMLSMWPKSRGSVSSAS